jgi:hypothetical protein
VTPPGDSAQSVMVMGYPVLANITLWHASTRILIVLPLLLHARRRRGTVSHFCVISLIPIRLDFVSWQQHSSNILVAEVAFPPRFAFVPLVLQVDLSLQ